uniref:Dihydrodipicolinate synthase family protein n=1 Tax=Roseihalotalea indica TaxID=2867963 RepID=A0AA49JFK3_9BACT|nr:dihydrodipicolinate synthase family protein [Tunicatimonas sp. TK19036]
MKESDKGFIPVMLTPFKPSGEVDYHGLTTLTEFYLDAGAKGLFANCLSSEMFALSPSERLQLTRHVVNVAKGRAPVVASGTFEGTVQQQADFVKEIYETGVQAVIIITSMLARAEESDAVLADRVDQLLDLTDPIPMGFYECPVPYKRVLSPELLRRFASGGRIKYHKDTCLDIEQVRAKLAAVTAPDFGLYDAYMVHAVESLKAGAAGLSCIQGNYFPELIVWLCDHYQDNSCQPEVQKLQNFLVQHMDIMHHAYPDVAKYYLQKRGLPITTTTRGKSGVLTAAVKQNIDAFYQECISFQDSLEIVKVV